MSSSEEIETIFIKQIFPNWEDIFGEDHEVLTIDFEASGVAPNLSVMPDSIKVVGKIAAHIKNPLNPEIDAAVIYFDVNTTFLVSV